MGGLIVIDLIDMRHKRHRNAVYQTLKEALRKDKARTHILPISQLGLLEMTRQRVDESIECQRRFRGTPKPAKLGTFTPVATKTTPC